MPVLIRKEQILKEFDNLKNYGSLYIEGTWSKDIVPGKDDKGTPVALGCWIVDCSPAASYWTPLSEQLLTTEVVKKLANHSFLITHLKLQQMLKQEISSVQCIQLLFSVCLLDSRKLKFAWLCYF